MGLARRESPARARRYLGWAEVLVRELPHTLAALRAGEATEWRAMIIARETGWLEVEHRATVDAELGPRLGGLSDRETEAAAKQAAYRLDPHGYVARCRGAHADRRVSIRPAPEAMARLSGFLPAAQGVAAFASLTRHADALIGAGDPRSRNQIMADTLVERVTGQATAAAVPAHIDLVMTDQTLFNRHPHHHHHDDHPDHPDGADGDGGGGAEDRDGADPDGAGAGGCAGGCGADEPAHLAGFGPIPADLARRLIADTDAEVWLRRLYTGPDPGALVAMESRGRLFTHGLRRFLIIRDQHCRTPWCDAAIRHLDHVVAAADRGATSAANGQGHCQACNYAKQAPGWRASPGPGGAGDTVVTTTPTGHTYTSRPPDPPRPPRPPRPPPPDAPSRLEASFREHVLIA